MTNYDILKTIHITCIALTFMSFGVRVWWMLQGSALLHTKIVRIVPHVIDTTLLASAIGLTFELKQYPLTTNWLTAKVVALVIYIVLGSIALKRGRNRVVRIYALFGALLTFFYIVGVALTRNPLIVI
jgi:uncharacterized membrane protein SirB2